MSQLSEQEVEKDVGRVDEGFLSADPSLSDPELDVGPNKRLGCSLSHPSDCLLICGAHFDGAGRDSNTAKQ